MTDSAEMLCIYCLNSGAFLSFLKHHLERSFLLFALEITLGTNFKSISSLFTDLALSNYPSFY